MTRLLVMAVVAQLASGCASVYEDPVYTCPTLYYEGGAHLIGQVYQGADEAAEAQVVASSETGHVYGTEQTDAEGCFSIPVVGGTVHVRVEYRGDVEEFTCQLGSNESRHLLVQMRGKTDCEGFA
jgi:hypothetical protein